MGKFDKLAKLLGISSEHADDASKVLKHIDSPEMAVKLNPEAREEYLQALDEVYGAKDKRIKDMGFSPETYYHGTGANFDEFNNSMLGSSNGPGVTKTQHWLSNNPDVAEVFAKQSANVLKDKNLIPLWKKVSENKNNLLKELKEQTGAPRPEGFLTQSDKMLDRMVEIGEITKEQVKKIKDVKASVFDFQNQSYKPSSGQNIIPVKIKEAGIDSMDAKGKYWGDVANQIGDREVKVKNLKEGRDDFFNSDMPEGTSIGVQDPSKIRSVNAAFDPRFAKSPLLLAGAGAVPTADISPLPKLSEALNVYSDLKDKATGALSRQLDISSNPEVQENIKDALSIAADPSNLIPGAPGAALGIAEMINAIQRKKK